MGGKKYLTLDIEDDDLQIYKAGGHLHFVSTESILYSCHIARVFKETKF